MGRSLGFLQIGTLLTAACCLSSNASAGGPSWILWRTEQFNTPDVLTNGETLGTGGWLTASIRNGGSITVSGGFAHVQTPDFYDSAMLRVTETLPPEYKMRVRIGGVDYDTGNYDPEDFTNPDFKYNTADSGTWRENGIYWLTLTDRLVVPTSGEDWWHRYRKIIIDCDDSSLYDQPVFIAYMNPNLDRNVGDWTAGYPNLLRTWSNGSWHMGTWDWEVAFQYSQGPYYEAEIEQLGEQLTFRVFDGNGALIEGTPPVDFDDIYAMDQPSYAYVGEPHVDSYEGEAYLDFISLWVPASTPVPGEPPPAAFALGQNRPNPLRSHTVIGFDLPLESDVRLALFDVTGRLVRTLTSGRAPAGTHEVEWDGRDDLGSLVPPGIYFYSLETGGFRQTRKALVIR